MSTVIKKSSEGRTSLIYGNNAPVALMQVSTKSGSPANKSKTLDGVAVPHVEATASKEEEEGKKAWIPWGVNDDFPKIVTKLIRKSTVGRAGLKFITKSLYGQRLITYKVVKGVTSGGTEVIEMVDFPEWDAILSRSNMPMVQLALSQDHAWFEMSMPQIRFNGNKTEIWAIDFQKTSHCRFAPADPKTGIIPSIYVSANFPDVQPVDCQVIPMIDSMQYHDHMEEIRADLKNLKYIMPQMWPDVLNDYYPVASWDSARESGYLDIAISIPTYIKALFKNQMSLKYHIDIPMEYFEDLYENTWHSLDDDAKDTIFTDLYEEIVEQLTGAENAQKALMTFSRTGTNGKPIGQWTITTIDDKSKSGDLLPNSSAANNEILASMNLSPAQIGYGNSGGAPNGGDNNGGSNIREGGLQMRSTLKPDRDILTQFFGFVKAWYNADPEIQLGIQDQVLVTLDEGRGTKKVVS
ncbi:hypothetical protein ACVWYN_002687 [Pedobacter sp. UYP24]